MSDITGQYEVSDVKGRFDVGGALLYLEYYMGGARCISAGCELGVYLGRLLHIWGAELGRE